MPSNGKPLAGKVTLVTGSAAGIGSASAVEFAREGADVVVNYSRSRDEAQQTLDQVKQLGARAILVQADCSKEDQVKDLVSQATKEFGGVDILVNNAGRTRFIPLPNRDEVTDEDWDSIL